MVPYLTALPMPCPRVIWRVVFCQTGRKLFLGRRRSHGVFGPCHGRGEPAPLPCLRCSPVVAFAVVVRLPPGHAPPTFTVWRTGVVG